MDSDGDRFIDSLEIADGTNPNDAASNQPRTNVYVQLGAPSPRMGTLANPTGTLLGAVPVVQTGGTVHFVNAGNINDHVTINKSTTLRAEGGTIRVGTP